MYSIEERLLECYRICFDKLINQIINMFSSFTCLVFIRIPFNSCQYVSVDFTLIKLHLLTGWCNNYNKLLLCLFLIHLDKLFLSFSFAIKKKKKQFSLINWCKFYMASIFLRFETKMKYFIIIIIIIKLI